MVSCPANFCVDEIHFVEAGLVLLVGIHRQIAADTRLARIQLAVDAGAGEINTSVDLGATEIYFIFEDGAVER